MFKGVLQPLDEIEQWYDKPDPWNYESNRSDQVRRANLLSVVPRKRYRRILDIGSGDGFITGRLPGDEVIGVDISNRAIQLAKDKFRDQSHLSFYPLSLFELPEAGWAHSFDLIVITGVLYPQYIAEGEQLAFSILDDLLVPGGHLLSVHIDEWYRFRFPYLTLHREYYSYREYSHHLEVYLK